MVIVHLLIKKCLKINIIIACVAESLIAYRRHMKYSMEKGIVGYSLNHKCTDMKIQGLESTVKNT